MKKRFDKPLIVLSQPLLWLDQREQETYQWLMEHFGIEITMLENTINLLSYDIEELEKPLQSYTERLEDIKKLTNSDSNEKLKRLVSLASLVQALDGMHACRRLLLSGYFSKMMASIRISVEAIRTADICRNDHNKAREWLNNHEIKSPTQGELHPIVKWMMQRYNLLSQFGGHPLFRSVVVSSMGKPYHEAMKGQPNQEGLMEATSTFIKLMNDFAARFLKYLDELHPNIWDGDDEMKIKRNKILS